MMNRVPDDNLEQDTNQEPEQGIAEQSELCVRQSLHAAVLLSDDQIEGRVVLALMGSAYDMISELRRQARDLLAAGG